MLRRIFVGRSCASANSAKAALTRSISARSTPTVTVKLLRIWSFLGTFGMHRRREACLRDPGSHQGVALWGDSGSLEALGARAAYPVPCSHLCAHLPWPGRTLTSLRLLNRSHIVIGAFDPRKAGTVRDPFGSRSNRCIQVPLCRGCMTCETASWLCTEDAHVVRRDEARPLSEGNPNARTPPSNFGRFEL